MKNKNIFKWSYLAFVGVMVILIIASLLGMRGLLNEYESDQPEYQAKYVLTRLAEDAKDADTFWEKYSLPETEVGDFEKDIDVKAKYLSLFDESEMTYSVKNGSYGEDEMHYIIRNGSMDLAELTLKATGEPKTKLFVFTSRDWSIEKIEPIFGKTDYTVQLPDYFTLSANGIELMKEDGTETDSGKIKYTVSGVYIEPKFEIYDDNGNEVSYVVKNNKVLPEYYDYTLVIPHTLSVSVNGETSEGIKRDDGLILHKLVFLEEPEVKVSDLYGNTVDYNGKTLPLTYMKVTVPDTYSVKCDGNNIPNKAVSKSDNPEFEFIVGLVDGIPQNCEYNIAILNAKSEISITDGEGNEVEFDKSQKILNLTVLTPLENVPESVSSKVDVLKYAQNWSLFMSNDYSFANVSKLLLPNSKQYKVAKEYSTSVDRTFFSGHSLLDPAFTDCKVENFVWITDDCFSVEISFVKHMRLTRTGEIKTDPMNDRFYFIKHNNQWLIAAMKEVTVNG